MKTFQQFQEQTPKPPIIKDLENFSTKIGQEIDPNDIKNLILNTVKQKLVTPNIDKLNDKFTNINQNKMDQSFDKAMQGFSQKFGPDGKAFNDLNKLFTELGIKKNVTPNTTPKVTPKVNTNTNTNNNIISTPGGMT